MAGRVRATGEASSSDQFGRLHIFLRLRRLPAGACGGGDFRATLIDRSRTDVVAVHGFAFMEHLNIFPPHSKEFLQLTQVAGTEEWKPQLYLRSQSAAGSPEFPLRYRFIDWNIPSAIDGEFLLPSLLHNGTGVDGGGSATDNSGAEFELRVRGWDWYCSFIPPDADLAAPPPARPAPQQGVAASADAVCPPRHSRPARHADLAAALGGAQGTAGIGAGSAGAGLLTTASTESAVREGHRLRQSVEMLRKEQQAGQGGQVLQAALPRARRRALQQQSHQQQARRGDGGTYVVMTPFFGVAVGDFVTLLLHHMRYHLKMGVSAYVMYLVEHVVEVSSDPRLEQYIADGSLRIVLWDSWARHETKPGKPSEQDVYAFQVLLYNHALLALWGAADALALPIDIDEYVMIPSKVGPSSASQPTLRDVFHQCGRQSAVVSLERFRAVCVHCEGQDLDSWLTPGQAGRSAVGPDTASRRLSDSGSTDATKVLQTSAGGTATSSGLFEHPFLRYAVTEFKEPLGKSLVDPTHLRVFRVHDGFPATPHRASKVPPTCARIAHLFNMFRVRVTRAAWPATTDRAVTEDPAWWWAARSPASGV